MSVPNFKHARILVVDDDSSMAPLVHALAVDASIGGSLAADITAATTLADGVRAAAEQRFDVIILDHLLPDGQGLDVVGQFIAQDRLRPILYITAQSGAHTAIEAIKQGAFDYLTKPLDFALLKQRICETLEYRRLTRMPVLIDGDGSRAADDCEGQEPDGQNDVLVGRCRAMQEVYKCIGRLASLPAPVLIEGEVGTGKEMIARAIHQYGSRQQAPFLKVNVQQFEAAIERSDAQAASHSFLTDLFPACDGGTLLLEELSALSSGLQSRLLELLKQQPTSPAGGVRLIASTVYPREQLLERGKLRSDLFYFLSPYTVRVPALRQREQDVELLVAHFMHRLARVAPASEHHPPPRVSPAAMDLLRHYDWPGNVAQLKSVLQSVLMESRGAVLATDALRRSLGSGQALGHAASTSVESEPIGLPSAARLAAHADDRSEASGFAWELSSFVRQRLHAGTDRLYEEVLSQLDRSLLQLVLQHTRGNQAQAAKVLGMTRTSLRKKIALAQIDLARLSQSAATSAGARAASQP